MAEVGIQGMNDFVRIGLLLEIGRTYGRRLCEGVASVALAREWELVLYSFDDVARGVAKADAFIAREIDEKTAKTLKKLKKPVVNIYSSDSGTGFSTVDCDHAAVGRLAAEHFLDHRFTNFAFCGYEGTAFSDWRCEAFARRLAQNHFDCIRYRTPRNALIDFQKDLLKGEWFRMGTDYRQMLAWVRKLPKPVAVFCSHDLRAYQLAQTCRRAGIDVPRDVAILGVDNDIIISSFSTPMLSSIDPDAVTVGRTAAETLAYMLETPGAEPRHVFVPPKGVVVRPSSEVYPLNPPWLSEALVFISHNIGRNLTSADVARHLGMSHTPVDRAFRSVLGTSVQKEIVRVRLEMAARLLQTTTLSVGEVAKRAGFTRSEYFCSCFRAKFGVKPSEYRRS